MLAERGGAKRQGQVQAGIRAVHIGQRVRGADPIRIRMGIPLPARSGRHALARAHRIEVGQGERFVEIVEGRLHGVSMRYPTAGRGKAQQRR